MSDIMKAMADDLPASPARASGRAKTRWWFVLLLLLAGVVALVKVLAL